MTLWRLPCLSCLKRYCLPLGRKISVGWYTKEHKDIGDIQEHNDTCDIQEYNDTGDIQEHNDTGD